MRPIGFSTGALALGNLDLALEMLDGVDVNAIELSALRVRELPRLLEFARDADLGRFAYISVHAPTDYEGRDEAQVVDRLAWFVDKGWPVIAHPDAIRDHAPWRRFGRLLLVENMDKRKPIGRTVGELRKIFDQLPDARMCFDIAHARQVDTSMTEAYRIVEAFHGLIEEVHISTVNSSSKHENITSYSANSYRIIASGIDQSVPVILETPATPSQITEQVELARWAMHRPKPQPQPS